MNRRHWHYIIFVAYGISTAVCGLRITDAGYWPGLIAMLALAFLGDAGRDKDESK